MTQEVRRTFQIEDMTVRADGGGRIIEAYAAVFDTPAEVTDWAGHYHERIAPQAFDKTIQERAGQIKVMFNHGRGIDGSPSDKFAMPIGVPEEIRPDGRGLFTRSRISATELGDEVLTLARDGAITGFSFRAKPMQSRDLGEGHDGLHTFERTEMGLVEYGPAILGVYEDAKILAVRAANMVRQMTDEERALFLQTVGDTFGPTPPSTEPGNHSEPTDTWRADALRAVLAYDLKEFRDGPTGTAPS